MLYDQCSHRLLKRISLLRDRKNDETSQTMNYGSLKCILLFYIFLIIENMRYPQYLQYLKRFERLVVFHEQKCDTI